MSPIKLGIDEDAMDGDWVAALVSRGVDVITALVAGFIGRPDEEHLAFAAVREYVLYTFNVSDFYRLHKQWMAAEGDHAGMIWAEQQRLCR